eukprot:2263467-Pyramimonas_sp.AAC.1
MDYENALMPSYDLGKSQPLVGMRGSSSRAATHLISNAYNDSLVLQCAHPSIDIATSAMKLGG